MKKLISIITILTVLIGAVPALAQVPGPGGPYNSAFTVQNLESKNGTCVYTIYNSSGSAAYTSTNVTIQANKSAFVYVGGLSMSPGTYSAVISCDVQTAAVSNYTGNGGAYAASFAGVSGDKTAATAYLPGLYKNYYGYFSNVVVQNAGNTPIDVTLKIYNGATLVDSETKTAPANASVVFDQATRASLSNGIYAGVVEATGPVAAMINVWNSAGQQFAYNGFTSGSAIAYAPVLMKSYYGFNTALTVQNIGNTSTTVTVTYSNGTTNTKTIPARASQLFYTPNEPGLPNGWLGSAKIEATAGSSIVALINESDANNRAASYTGFATGGTTSNAPIVLNKYYGYSTSVTCQNIGTAATNITITYSNGTIEVRNNIAINGAALFYQPNAGLPNGFNGSAIITASQPIVCVINENQVENPNSQDYLLTYEGIVQ
ncbi:MAG: hypothetical protein QXU75_07040 [Candidatus Methanomethylicaceae archaeon]